MNLQRRIDSGLSAQDERSINAVLIAYATAIDTRDWALFRSCFTADCKADYGDFGSWTDVTGLTDYMREAHSRLGPTLHRISNIRMSGVQGGATAHCYVDALLCQMNEAGPVHRGIGSYEDFLVRTGDGWRIARRNFKLITVE